MFLQKQFRSQEQRFANSVEHQPQKNSDIKRQAHTAQSRQRSAVTVYMVHLSNQSHGGFILVPPLHGKETEYCSICILAARLRKRLLCFEA